MIKIAVIDDDKIFCTQIEKIINESCDKLQIKSEIDIYFSGEKFCESLCKNKNYSLIFLDIKLMNMDGVDVGKYIRNNIKDNNMQIIFVSSVQEYAMQLFQIRPMDFIIKPVCKEIIYNCIEKYIDLFLCEDYFQFKSGKVNYHLSYDTIIFFESKNRIVKIHTNDEILECYAKLSDIEIKLPKFFYRIHKSYIINQNYIIRHSIDGVTMSDGTSLNISRQYRKSFNEYMMLKNCGGGEEFFDE